MGAPVAQAENSNDAEVMAIAPNVIPRSKATWESPKKKRKTQWRLPLTALVLAISTAQKIFAIS